MSNDRYFRLAGITLNSPLRACAFFASKEEEYRVLLPFMTEGIAAGDTCVNIVDHADCEERLRRLAGAGIDVAEAERSGQLKLLTWDHAILADAPFDQHAMLASNDPTAASGPHKGGITRVWSNHDCVFGGVPGSHDLIGYASQFNAIWPKYRDVSICVYDTTKCSGDVLTNVLRANPFAIVEGILRENPFYVPPREQLDDLRRLSGVASMKEHAHLGDAEGLAALSICESIILALNDVEVIGENDVRNLLTDVATTHQQAAAMSESPARHKAVVDIVNRMLAGSGSLRH